MENVEDMESESAQMDCLDVPQAPRQVLLPVVVLRKIFENLSSADLVNLSLVNKELNYETRSVLWERGIFTAKMNTGDGRIKDLIDFAADLRRMREVRKVVPFSGLTIVISGKDDRHGACCTESSAGTLDQALEDILHQMEWKHLTLNLRLHWDRKEDCAGFKLVKKILHNRSCVLEELSLKIHHHHREAFIQHFLEDRSFSRLKTLKFLGRRRGGNENFIKALVSRAPNLKVLFTDCFVDLKANVLEGSAAVHAIDDPFTLIFDDGAAESAVGRLRVRNISLGSNREDFNLQSFNRMMRMLLQTSRTTLSFLDVRATFLVPLMNFGIDLENLRKLDVTLYSSDPSQPRARRLLNSLDFNRVFPNLSSVRILCRAKNPPNLERVWNALSEMVEQGNAAFIEPVNRTANIKELILCWIPGIPDSFIRFLVEMFPVVEKLSIITPRLPVRIWDNWLNLEELGLFFVLDVLENLDSLFCGIFPEEVAELRERDEEFLRKVNIVPVMPSLCSLKRLKTFRVTFDETVWFNGGTTSTLSKVTGLVAFKRHPDLSVTLATNNLLLRHELEQMESYASIQMTQFSFLSLYYRG